MLQMAIRELVSGELLYLHAEVPNNFNTPLGQPP
jgi:hypothetical protein